MRTPPLRCLPILSPLLHQLCNLTPSLGALGLALWVCLTFGFFTMLRQSNLAPRQLPCSTHPGTPARGTSSSLILTFTSLSSGPRLISQWGGCQYYPSQKCQDTLPSQSWPIICFSLLPHHITTPTAPHLPAPGASNHVHRLPPVQNPGWPPTSPRL